MVYAQGGSCVGCCDGGIEVESRLLHFCSFTTWVSFFFVFLFFPLYIPLLFLSLFLYFVIFFFLWSSYFDTIHGELVLILFLGFLWGGLSVSERSTWFDGKWMDGLYQLKQSGRNRFQSMVLLG